MSNDKIENVELDHSKPVPIQVGWSCPKDYAYIKCDNCGHIFGNLKPELRKDAKVKNCEFCVEKLND